MINNIISYKENHDTIIITNTCFRKLRNLSLKKEHINEEAEIEKNDNVSENKEDSSKKEESPNLKLEIKLGSMATPPPVPSSAKPKPSSGDEEIRRPPLPLLPKPKSLETDDELGDEDVKIHEVKGSPPSLPTSQKPKYDTIDQEIKEENEETETKESNEPPIIPILPKPKAEVQPVSSPTEVDVPNIKDTSFDNSSVDDYLEAYLLELQEMSPKKTENDPDVESQLSVNSSKNKVLSNSSDSELISNANVITLSDQDTVDISKAPTSPTLPNPREQTQKSDEKEEIDNTEERPASFEKQDNLRHLEEQFSIITNSSLVTWPSLERQESSSTTGSKSPQIHDPKLAEEVSLISNSSLVTLESLERQESSSTTESKSSQIQKPKLVEQFSLMSNSSLVTLESLEIHDSFDVIPKSGLSPLLITRKADEIAYESPSISLNNFEICDDSDDDDDEGPKIRRTPREKRISSKYSSNKSLNSPSINISDTDMSPGSRTENKDEKAPESKNKEEGFHPKSPSLSRPATPSESQSMALLLDLNEEYHDEEDITKTSSLKRTPKDKRASSKYMRNLSQKSSTSILDEDNDKSSI